MFFGKTLAAAALALLTCVSAAPAVEVSSQPAGSVLSNAERIVRGLGVNRPKRLFGESRTGNAAPAKRSAGVGDVTTSNLAFTTTGPSTKRGLATFFATVVDGQLVTSAESQDAAAFVMPYFDGTPFGSISWIPSTTKGEYTAGQRYDMYGVATSGIVSLRFGTPPSNAITDLFAQPAYTKGLQPHPVISGAVSQDFIWVTDSEGKLYLAPDIGTAVAQLSGVRALLPVQYAMGTFPDFTDAIATKETALVNPARLWAVTYGNSRSGYVKVDTRYQNALFLANDISDSLIFYAPNYSPGSTAPQRLITSLNGQTLTAVSTSAFRSVDLRLTADNTTDSLLFTIPANQAGIVSISVNGETDYQLGIGMYGPNLNAFLEADFAASLYYSNYKGCMEMVPIGAEPQYCAPIVDRASYEINPSSFYAATKSGSVGGYLQGQADGSIDFSSSASTWFAPDYFPNNSGATLRTMIGDKFPALSAPVTAGAIGMGPFSLSTSESDLLPLPAGRSGLMYPPKYVKNAYGEYKYYYNNADKSIYVFASDADAQAFAPNMEELCLESVLPGAAPGVCALYLQTGAVDLGETNPVQIYIRQINATGTPITGWLTSKNNLGMAATQIDAATWYLPQAPGVSGQLLTTIDRRANTVIINPGTSQTQAGVQFDYSQPSIAPSVQNGWATNWVSASALVGGIVTPEFTYKGQPVSWTWVMDTEEYYKIFRIFSDLTGARAWLPTSNEFCFETVPVGGAPTGACAAKYA